MTAACRYPLRSHGVSHAVVMGVSDPVSAAVWTAPTVRREPFTGCAQGCGKPCCHAVTEALTGHSRGQVIHSHAHTHDSITARRETAGRSSHGCTHGTHARTHSRFRPPLYRGAERVPHLR